MTIVTIPKKFASNDDLVVIPRLEYEKLLALKKIISVFKASRTELKIIELGRRDAAKNKITSWAKVKNELGNLPHRSR